MTRVKSTDRNSRPVTPAAATLCVKDVFDKYDINDRGSLDFDELMSAMTHLNGGRPVSRSALEMIIKEADGNIEGMFNLEQFEKIFITLDSFSHTVGDCKNAAVEARVRRLILYGYFGFSSTCFCISMIIYWGAYTKPETPYNLAMLHASKLGCFVSGAVILLGVILGICVPVTRIKTYTQRMKMKDYIDKNCSMAALTARTRGVKYEEEVVSTQIAPEEPPTVPRFSYRRYPKARLKMDATPRDPHIVYIDDCALKEPVDEELANCTRLQLVEHCGAQQDIIAATDKAPSEAGSAAIGGECLYSRDQYEEAARMQEAYPKTGGFNPMTYTHCERPSPTRLRDVRDVEKVLALEDDMPCCVNDTPATTYRTYTGELRPSSSTSVGLPI